MYIVSNAPCHEALEISYTAQSCGCSENSQHSSSRTSDCGNVSLCNYRYKRSLGAAHTMRRPGNADSDVLARRHIRCRRCEQRFLLRPEFPPVGRGCESCIDIHAPRRLYATSTLPSCRFGHFPAPVASFFSALSRKYLLVP